MDVREEQEEEWWQKWVDVFFFFRTGQKFKHCLLLKDWPKLTVTPTLSVAHPLSRHFLAERVGYGVDASWGSQLFHTMYPSLLTVAKIKDPVL